jgi:hypothetical protein
MRLLDRNFKYVPAAETDVASTFRRFGFRPTTEKERRARIADHLPAARRLAGVTPLDPQHRPDPLGRRKLKLAIGK